MPLARSSESSLSRSRSVPLYSMLVELSHNERCGALDSESAPHHRLIALIEIQNRGANSVSKLLGPPRQLG